MNDLRPHSLLTIALLLGLAACSSGAGDEPVAAILAQQALSLEYIDAAGETRIVNIEIRPPAGTVSYPVPLVLWSHGGSQGKVNPTTVGTGWTPAFVNAGFCMVAIAHPGRDCGSRERLMAALGFPAGQACDTWKHLNWDRPHDAKRVMDYLEAESQPGGSLDGLVDMTRLAYAGHSAGSGSALVIAGAQREINGTPRDLSDPRPTAFLSCSPQPVGNDDFTVASYQGLVSRPHLTLTGMGDTTGGIPNATGRRDPFQLIAPGDKYIGWIQDGEAAHTTFNAETDGCANRGGTPAQCGAYVEWLHTAAIAFLRAYMNGDASAMAILQTQELSTRTAGAMIWMAK